MTALTRRRNDTENLEQWSVYDRDVCIGVMTRVNGTGGKMIWQWSCGMKGTPNPSGSTDTFDEARDALQSAWEKIAHLVAPAMRDEWLYEQAWTSWKYAMWDAHCKLPTQNTNGRSRCFCGAEITDAGLSEHIRAKHMGTNPPPRA